MRLSSCLSHRPSSPLFRTILAAGLLWSAFALPAVAQTYQGYGYASQGGTGGAVYHVTSLADSGAGTLRDGITNRTGARIILFDVAGTITLLSDLNIKLPFLTIDGSTAPAPGITITHTNVQNNLTIQGTHDVILRDLRFRGAYAGTVILISHDRDFLDRVVNLVLAPESDGRWIEYAGGYSDMLAQRGADLAGRKPQRAKVAMPAKTASAPSPSKRKLSFNDQHALKTLPKEIATLQKRIAGLQQQLEDPAFYARDPKSFAETTQKLAAAQSQLASAEEKWLELEMLREEIEGS